MSNNTIFLSSRDKSPSCSVAMAVRTRSRSGSVRLLPMIQKVNITETTSPSPPRKMSAHIIACPKGVQYVAVVTRVNPVVETAEVAVKNAMRGGVMLFAVLLTGNVSSMPPAMQRRAIPMTLTNKGLESSNCLRELRRV